MLGAMSRIVALMLSSSSWMPFSASSCLALSSSARSEVKSLRESKVQLQDAYAVFFQRELWLVGLNISSYSHSGAAFAHDNDRRRKLLAHRHQLENWSSRVDREGLASIPLALYFKDGRAKISMGLARGKKQHDRRQDIAKRDADLDARKAMSRANRADRLAKYS